MAVHHDLTDNSPFDSFEPGDKSEAVYEADNEFRLDIENVPAITGPQISITGQTDTLWNGSEASNVLLVNYAETQQHTLVPTTIHTVHYPSGPAGIVNQMPQSSDLGAGERNTYTSRTLKNERMSLSLTAVPWGMRDPGEEYLYHVKI